MVGFNITMSNGKSKITMPLIIAYLFLLVRSAWRYRYGILKSVYVYKNKMLPYNEYMK